MYREQLELIKKDIDKKIVFVVGPRQVGKTWISKELGKSFKKTVYLSFDRREDREIIENESWLESTELLIFDELHKMKGWKNYIKGIFDTKPAKMKILVTGSARLDTFKQGGESLAGRFFTHRLLPFTPAELLKTDYKENNIDRFIERGGFPEPFLEEDLVNATRWRTEYITGLIREDVLNFENIMDLKAISLVLDILRSRVGSLVSYSSIARDVELSVNTVKKYINIFESLYIIFRVTPFSKNISRSLLKEPKIYFFDNGLVQGDDGIKFENLVALSLLKNTLKNEDTTGENWSLNYLRTKDGREVDLCVVKNGNPEYMVEVKNRDKSVSKNLHYFKDRYDIKAIQVVKELRLEKIDNGVTVRRGIDFLKEL